MWKDCFPEQWQETIHVDARTGERHIADVRADSGLVVEVQHSPMAAAEMRAREDFYGEMIWIVDARDLHGYFSLGTSSELATCDPMSYHFQWFSRSTLMRRWSEARKPVFFDTLFENSLTRHVKTPSGEHLLWSLFQFDPAEGSGFIGPVRSDQLVQAVRNGNPVPVMQCAEDDAWRFRRRFPEVPFLSTGSPPPRTETATRNSSPVGRQSHGLANSTTQKRD